MQTTEQTRWYQSEGQNPLPSPIALDPASSHKVGDIYVHWIEEDNTEGRAPQIWIWKHRVQEEDPSWVEVRDLTNEYHPSSQLHHLLLRFTDSWNPSWVVSTTAKRRDIPQLYYHRDAA